MTDNGAFQIEALTNQSRRKDRVSDGQYPYCLANNNYTTVQFQEFDGIFGETASFALTDPEQAICDRFAAEPLIDESTYDSPPNC